MQHRIWISIPLAIGLAGCGDAPPEKAAAPAPTAVAVSTVPASAENWPSIYEATGTVRARTSAVISAKIMGYVREVNVQAGDRVREGQLLVNIDARDLDVNARRADAARDEVRTAMPEADSAVAAAKANLDLAQVTFLRMQESVRQEVHLEPGIRRSFGQAQGVRRPPTTWPRRAATQLDSKLAQADQEVRSTEVTRSYAEVRSPFAGVVISKSVEPGNLAMPGAPLFTIEREGAYRLEAAVEESQLATIRVGHAAAVTLDGLARSKTTVLKTIAPSTPEFPRSSRPWTPHRVRIP